MGWPSLTLGSCTRTDEVSPRMDAAAEQGLALAQHNLGFMYQQGRGVTQDDREAVRWYRAAAEQGNAKAQTNLGFMYYRGRGVARDDRQALRWYRAAAEQGDAEAQFNLGVMCATGKGVLQDHVQAYQWSQLAASSSTDGVREAAAVIRDVMAKEMTREQIDEARRLAREWKPRAGVKQ